MTQITLTKNLHLIDITENAYKIQKSTEVPLTEAIHVLFVLTNRLSSRAGQKHLSLNARRTVLLALVQQ